MDSVADYKPISDYGAIGNLRTVALVGRDGSIDWCCLPQLDSPSVFAALLDGRRGGRFSVSPTHRLHAEQHYVPDTNVLVTRLDAPGGRLQILDAMPVEASLVGCGGSRAHPEILRLLMAEGAAVDVDIVWAPRFDYARAIPVLEARPGGAVARHGDIVLTLSGLSAPPRIVEDADGGPMAHARITLKGGERLGLSTRLGEAAFEVDVQSVHRRIEQTVGMWREWIRAADRDRSWADPWRDAVVRSELTLKLLSHADTGAIAAAATTSLPECVGGERNWDYRFSWIRDAALAAQALFALGHPAEAQAFVSWAERAAHGEKQNGFDGLKIVYGLHGDETLDEETLSHLEGYRRSAPVRIGNEAAHQLQLDIYGELISAAYELTRMKQALPDDVRAMLPRIADQACAAWREPDHGIWEVRDGLHHFVYSKAMVWMALDRAVAMTEDGVIQGDVDRWRRTADAVRNEILERGWSDEAGAFVRTYGSTDLDASNLLLPMMELLRFDDPRVQSTLDRTMETLADGELVHRYHAEDGLSGKEGAFGLCSFWLIDALCLSGRVDEAERLFDAMVSRQSHVGLFSEQIDPETGNFLGNFPQAFTHLGLVNSALYLAHAKGRPSPVEAPIGSEAHRRRFGRT
jgi:pentatricopeptide repeat protein